MKMRSRLTALLLAVLMMISTAAPALATAVLPLPQYQTMVRTAAEQANSEPQIDVGGEVYDLGQTAQPVASGYDSTVEVALATGDGEQTVALPVNGKVLLTTDIAAGQWQVQVGEAWVDMYGETDSTIEVTFAKVQSLFAMNNAAKLRFISADGSAVSCVANVGLDYSVQTLEEEVAMPMMYSARSVDANAGVALAAEGDEEEPTTVIVEIAYRFQDGTTAASSYTAQIGYGSDLTTSVIQLPYVQGYLATFTETAGVTFVAPSDESNGTIQITLEKVTADQIFVVTYVPAYVSFTVEHYLMGFDAKQDTAVHQTSDDQTITTKRTNEAVGDELAKTYSGFRALWYDSTTKVAADGSTVIKIYYERNWYLMLFDLGGGYGVEPIYAQYGAPVEVGTPTRAGYVFDGWLDADGNAVQTLPTTMPADNVTYTAKWKEANSTFTVVYWLENADDENYSVFGMHSASGTTGATVNGETYKAYARYIETDSNFKAVEPFVEYERADANVAVKGDNSTVVNVYFSRKEFTLKFYYAMEDTTNNKYYVIGGSTYAFGASGRDEQPSYRNITNYYMNPYSDWIGNRGEVDEIPTLNAAGQARNYTEGFDEDSGWNGNNNSNYRYHYVSFTAKYGANISKLWPCDVFNSVTRKSANTQSGWNGREAFVSAWNGEYRVLYSQQNRYGNQTIKGNYEQLVTEIMWDYGQFGAYADNNNTIEYMCFWENGADIKWSVPELFRYQIWVPVIEGQDVSGEKTKDHKGVTYYLRNTYDTIDDSDYENQTAPTIQGLTYTHDYYGEEITNPNEELYAKAHEVHFFYTRNQYHLSFVNDGKEEKNKQIYFEADLTKENYTPSYPASLEPDAYEFAGWYTSSVFAESTRFDFEGKTMPANDIILYAKWVPVSHTVTIYENAGDTTPLVAPFEVAHGEYADVSESETQPEASKFPSEAYMNSIGGGKTFVGWFYQVTVTNEDGTTSVDEIAFDPNNMPVRSNLNIYAKWSMNDPINFKIHYYLMDADGNPVLDENDKNVAVAETLEGYAMYGSTVTVNAKTGNELYEEYREGFFPHPPSHSVVVEIAEEGEENVNEYIFWYTQATNVPYRVMYVTTDENGNYKEIEGVDSKYVEKNSNTVVTENYVRVSGYMPDEYQKRLIVAYGGSTTDNGNYTADDDENIIFFYYVKDEVNAYYTVEHYIEPIGGVTDTAPWQQYGVTETYTGEIGQSYTAAALTTLAGFTYDANRNQVDKYDGGGNKTELTGPDAALTQVLTAGGMDYRLYYKRNEYPVKVQYLEQGTNKVLADAELYTVTEGGINISTFDYQSQVQVTTDKAFHGYTLISANPQTLQSVSIDGDTLDAIRKNVVTFYYQKTEVEINYVGVAPDGTLITTEEQKATIGSVTPEAEPGTAGVVTALDGPVAGSTATAASNVYKFAGWYLDENCTQPVPTGWVDGNNKIVPQKQNRDDDEATAPLYESATYYAKFEYNLTSLTISKSGMPGTETAIFDVLINGESFTTVAVPSGDSVMIAGLTVGDRYKVKEQGDWTWRYNVSSSNAEGTLVAGGNTASFANAPDETKWLDDEYGVHNDFGDSNVTPIK